MTKLHVRPLSEIRHEIPADLNGSNGSNRGERSMLQIKAENDYEAIDAFLSEYDGSPGTLRQFTRECERVALWAFHELGKPVSSLSRQDIDEYLKFLMDPQPADIWCGPKVRREKPEWRPFVGGLEEGAILNTLTALNSMLSWWVAANYLRGNPLALMRQRRRKMAHLDPSKDEKTPGKKKAAAKNAPAGKHGLKTDEAEKAEHILDTDMWNAVMAAVEEMKSDDPAAAAEYERARFICSFMVMLAPRVGEMETHTMNSFREREGRWWWHVVGKGSKAARIPVPAGMVEAMVRYRHSLGLTAMPSKKDDSPLLRSTRHPGNGITARWLNMLLKQIFRRAAELLPAHLSHKAADLRSASAHWGRHTGITRRIDAGIDRNLVRKEARHGDIRTTERYIHEEDRRWHAETQKHTLGWRESGEEATDAPKPE